MGSGTEKIAMRTNNKDEEAGERFAGIAIYLAPLCGRKLQQAKTFVNFSLGMVLKCSQ